MLTLVEKVLMLAEVPIFAETRTADLAHLAATLREVEVARGEVVHREGDPPDALHVIVSGRLRFERGDGARVERSEGAFGVGGLLDQRPREWTVTALEPSQLLLLDRDAFVDVMSDHVNVARGVLRVLSGRLRQHLQSGRRGGPEDVEMG